MRDTNSCLTYKRNSVDKKKNKTVPRAMHLNSEVVHQKPQLSTTLLPAVTVKVGQLWEISLKSRRTPCKMSHTRVCTCVTASRFWLNEYIDLKISPFVKENGRARKSKKKKKCILYTTQESCVADIQHVLWKLVTTVYIVMGLASHSQIRERCTKLFFFFQLTWKLNLPIFSRRFEAVYFIRDLR